MRHIYIYIHTHTHTHTHTMEYYSGIKKNEILLFVTTWMDLKDILLSIISQTQKDKYCMWNDMWNLKTKTNKDKTETDSQIQRTN